MSIEVYSSATEYLGTKSSLREKIAAVDAIIATLLTTAATMAEKDYINEYWLNDGQTQIKTVYKGADDVEKSIVAFERLRMMYANRLQGRMVRLMDAKNFNGC